MKTVNLKQTYQQLNIGSRLLNYVERKLTMRIKQNDLPITPDYQYSRLICGVLGTVQIFHEPELCVNIIQLKYNKRIAHCYPIDSATYARYKREAIDWYYPDKK